VLLSLLGTLGTNGGLLQSHLSPGLSLHIFLTMKVDSDFSLSLGASWEGQRGKFMPELDTPSAFLLCPFFGQQEGGIQNGYGPCFLAPGFLYSAVSAFSKWKPGSALV
jgi:hypothetical protein